jgi:hypothetical protein
VEENNRDKRFGRGSPSEETLAGYVDFDRTIAVEKLESVSSPLDVCNACAAVKFLSKSLFYTHFGKDSVGYVLNAGTSKMDAALRTPAKGFGALSQQ